MERNTSRNIINVFLYLLILILLGIILYLLLLAYQGKLAQDAFNNANPPRLSGDATDQAGNSDQGSDISSQLIAGQLNDTSNWQLHESKLASFSFKYPPLWTVDENQSASFIVLRNEKGINMITVRVINKTENLADLDFRSYASRAGGEEIQGFQTIAEFYQILAQNDIVAYQAKWNVQFLGGEKFVSPPITYFSHPFDDHKSIQFVLENNDYRTTYDLIVESFQYT